MKGTGRFGAGRFFGKQFRFRRFILSRKIVKMKNRENQRINKIFLNLKFLYAFSKIKKKHKKIGFSCKSENIQKLEEMKISNNYGNRQRVLPGEGF